MPATVDLTVFAYLQVLRASWMRPMRGRAG